MPDEPTLGELQRLIESVANAQREGFASVNASVSRLVSQEVFLAEQRRVDERHAALQADIAEEKAERIAAIKDEKTERIAADTAEQTAREAGLAKEKTEREKVGIWVRWTLATILIPTILLIVDLVQGKP
jgi:hypothetical protein